MNPLVQSALDAAKEGDKKKAVDLIQQALESTPHDIDALLALATIADENAQKRRVLNRVLSLDPTNKEAREMLLEMDRAELSSYRSQAAIAPVASIQTAPDVSLKKPLTFRFSTTGLVVLYVFATLSCCATLWFAAIDMTDGFPFLAMALVLGLTILTLSSKVEVSEAGIQTSSFIGSREIKWNEIASIKANPLKGILELRSDIGDVVNVSTQIMGYRDILDILRLKRPDLFPQVGSAPVPHTEAPAKSDVLESVQSSSPISTPHSQLAPEPIVPQPVIPSSEKINLPLDPPQEKAPLPAAQSSVSIKKGRKLLFALPLFWRLFMYSFPTFLGLIGLLVAFQNVLYSLPFLVLALLLGLVAMAFSPKVEITETGIRAYGMFDSPEAQWNEIVQMKSNPMKRRLELFKTNGEFVGVSNQVSGYPRLVEIIRQKRPDLFKLESQSAPSTTFSPTAEGTAATNPDLSFTGIKTFKKNTFAQYGVILLMIPLCLVGIWFIAIHGDKFVGIGIGAIGLFFMVASLFSIHQIKVEPNKVTTESLFAQKEYTASQIRGIEMKTVRSRHGVASNFVNIQLVEGGAISMAGFPEGDEMIYGVLHEWWETYRNR